MVVLWICDEVLFVLFPHGPLNKLSSGIDVPANWGKRENVIIINKIRNNLVFQKNLFIPSEFFVQEIVLPFVYIFRINL